VRALREAGVEPGAILGKLAHGLGMTADDRARSAPEVVEEWRRRDVAWPRDAWRVPVEWAGIGPG